MRQQSAQKYDDYIINYQHHVWTTSFFFFCIVLRVNAPTKKAHIMTNNTLKTSPRGDGKLPGAQKTTWTETHFKIFEFCHKWTIHKFSHLKMKPGEKLVSSIFSAENHEAEKWQLQLYPFGVKAVHEANLSLYLYRKCKPGAINAKFRFSIIDESGVSNHGAEFTHTFDSEFPGYGRPQFITREFLEQSKDKLLKGDKLVLLCKGSYTCDLTVVAGITKTGITAALQLAVPESKALDDFGALLETQQFSDVILDVCGTEFHAHKAILSARSTVFAAMFNNEMREQKENRVTIIDTDPQVIGELLRFIYTDKAPKLEDIAAKLICVADKYDVLRLKKMCAATLSKGLSIDNASDTLILADLHDADELKTMTLDFISSHAEAVMDTEGYKSMIKTHLQLSIVAVSMIFLRLKSNEKAKRELSR